MIYNRYQLKRINQQSPEYLQKIIDRLKKNERKMFWPVTHIVVAQTIKTLEGRIRELKKIKKS